MNTTRPNRADVEHLVRETLQKQTASCRPGKRPPNELKVNVSARHIHISQENLEILFGPGYKLEPMRALFQEGQFAAKETVTLIGPRNRIIPNMRILGPCRSLTQVELSFTDGIQLGFELPVRLSGEIQGTPGGYIMGPKGLVELPCGIIRAARHIHMGPADAEYYGVKHKDLIGLRIVASQCTTVFEDLLVRVDPSFRLEAHLDTDEGNACHIDGAERLELVT
jgi:putative phosphotransacetylase